jgi:hypothetical protein
MGVVSRRLTPYVRFSAGGVPGRIRSRLPVSGQQTCPAVTSQSSPDICWSQRLLSSTCTGSPPVPHERPSLRGPPCVVRLPVRAPVLRHPRHKVGPAESPQEGGKAPHSRTKCAPWGTPAVGRTGGTAVHHRTASHERSPALRGGAAGPTCGGIFFLIPSGSMLYVYSRHKARRLPATLRSATSNKGWMRWRYHAGVHFGPTSRRSSP